MELEFPYLDGPYLSADKGAISTYFTEMEDASAHSDTMPGGNGELDPDLQPGESFMT